MSLIAALGDQSTSKEVLALTNLSALATSPSGQYIRKTGESTFENATPAGVNSFVDPIAPTGDINGVNKIFTAPSTPSPATSLKVYQDGQLQQLNVDYTFSGETITFTDAPVTDTTLSIDYRI